MVYRKKFYRRKFHRKGAKLNTRQKKEVKRLIRGDEEVKFADSAFVQTITNTANISLIASPPQGSSQVQRVGDQIMIKKMRLALSFTGAGAALGVVDQTNFVRVLLIKWSQNNNVTTPSIGDILQYVAVTGQAISSPYNNDSIDQGKVKICYDKVLTFTQSGTQCRQVNTHIYGKRLHGGKLTFNNATTLGTGQYYLVTISDSGVAPSPALLGYLRYWYTDA